VIFTDEAAIEIGAQTVQFVRRGQRKALTPAHFKQLCGFTTKVMFWGTISVFGVGPLVPITGIMNSDKYITTLTQHLLPAAQHWFGGSLRQLFQDGAPWNKSIKTTQFLNANGIDCVPWP